MGLSGNNLWLESENVLALDYFQEMGVSVVVALQVLDFISLVVKSVVLLFISQLCRSCVTGIVILDQNVLVRKVPFDLSSFGTVLFLMLLGLNLWTFFRSHFIRGQLLDTEIKESLFRNVELQIVSVGPARRNAELVKSWNKVGADSSWADVTGWEEVLQVLAVNSKTSVKTECLCSFIVHCLLFNVLRGFLVCWWQSLLYAFEFSVQDWFFTSPVSFVTASNCGEVSCFSANFTCSCVWVFDSTRASGSSFFHQVHQFIWSLIGNESWSFYVAWILGFQNEMGFMNWIDIIGQEFFAINIQVNKLPVAVGKCVDEFHWSGSSDTCVATTWGHIVFVIFGKDVVSFGPELENDKLPWLFQIHTPKWFSTFFIDRNEVINHISLPSSVVINNSMIQATGLEILSEH